MDALRTFPHSLLLALGLLLATAGCSSHKTPQDVCDCLNQQADAYLAKHPDLTKTQLEDSGNDVLNELVAACKTTADEAEQQLKQADLDTQTKTKEQMQTCIDNLRDKMRAAAKDETVSEAGDQHDPDDPYAAAEKRMDAAMAAAQAGKATAETGSSDTEEAATGSVSDENWNEMLANYEQYVTQYATMMRKGAKGDMSALSESAGIMAKAQELEQQLKEYAGKATAAQNAQFAKVQARALQTMLQAQQSK